MSSSGPGWGSAGHAQDANDQFYNLDDARPRLEVLDGEGDPRRLLGGGVRRRRSGHRRGRDLGLGGVRLRHHGASNPPPLGDDDDNGEIKKKK